MFSEIYKYRKEIFNSSYTLYYVLWYYFHILKMIKMFSLSLIAFVNLVLCQEEHLPAEQTEFFLVHWSIERYTENNLKIIYSLAQTLNNFFLSTNQFLFTWLVTFWKLYDFINGFPLFSEHTNQGKINLILDIFWHVHKEIKLWVGSLLFLHSISFWNGNSLKYIITSIFDFNPQPQN